MKIFFTLNNIIINLEESTFPFELFCSSLADIGGALAFSTSEVSYNGTNYNKPKTADELHRSGGIASMMRLPIQETAQGKQTLLVRYTLNQI